MLEPYDHLGCREPVSPRAEPVDAAAGAMELHLRDALPEPVADITALQRAALAAGPPGFHAPAMHAAWWRTPATGLDELIACGRYHVVMLGRRPLAGAGWVPAPTAGEALLRAVFVDPRVAGRGLGARCVACVESDVANLGRHRLVAPAALNAVVFYERLGFRVMGNGFEEPEPGICVCVRRMEKWLEDDADAGRTRPLLP